MAKGKKYKKWFEKHGDERKIRYKNTIPINEVKEIEPTKELSHPVHGYFMYECESCGTVYQMYLDKGLEDRVQDKEYPDKHKPVPFIIGCRKCNGGLAKHILWGIGDSDEYEELPDGASYFENTPDGECGKAVINETFRNKDHWQKVNLFRKFGGGIT